MSIPSCCGRARSDRMASRRHIQACDVRYGDDPSLYAPCIGHSALLGHRYPTSRTEREHASSTLTPLRHTYRGSQGAKIDEVKEANGGGKLPLFPNSAHPWRLVSLPDGRAHSLRDPCRHPLLKRLRRLLRMTAGPDCTSDGRDRFFWGGKAEQQKWSLVTLPGGFYTSCRRTVSSDNH